MAATAPDIARSAVTWGAGGALTEEMLPLVEAMATMVANPSPPFVGFREYVIGAYGEAGARATLKSFAGGVRAIIERGGDISLLKAGDITCPALLMVGELDTIAPPSLVTRLAARIPNAELMVVEGAGHDVHNARPEWFAQTVLDWLRKH